jgi:hypothetical protein
VARLTGHGPFDRSGRRELAATKGKGRGEQRGSHQGRREAVNYSRLADDSGEQMGDDRARWDSDVEMVLKGDFYWAGTARGERMREVTGRH